MAKNYNDMQPITDPSKLDYEQELAINAMMADGMSLDEAIKEWNEECKEFVSKEDYEALQKELDDDFDEFLDDLNDGKFDDLSDKEVDKALGV